MGRLKRMGAKKTGHRFTPINTDEERRKTWMDRMGKGIVRR
jgi:hypothetical protein